MGKRKCFLKGASKRCRTQILLVGSLHCISSMLLAKEATAESQEGMIILDVAKIDLMGIKVESNKTVVV